MVTLMPTAKTLVLKARDAWERRRALAMTPDVWDRECVDLKLRSEVQAAEEAGLFDPRLLDSFEDKMVDLLLGQVARHLDPLREGVGDAIAESTFGGTDYRNRLDRQLATGAAAAADMAIEEALFLGVAYAGVLIAEQNVALRPAWPVDAKRAGRSSEVAS